MNVPQAANTRLVERFTELAIQTFLWAFRIVVILVVVVGSILTLVQGRYSAETWIDLAITGAVLGSVYALIALGYTMVYGILRMINFAHGEIFMAGMFAGYFTAVGLAGIGILNAGPLAGLLSVAIMCAVAAVVATAIALLVERIAYRPLRNAPRLVPLISAIGASFVLQYSFRGFFGPGIYAYPTIDFLEGQVPIPFLNIQWVEVLVIGAAIAMMAGLYFFVMRSKMGTAIRAVSEDKSTAALMGIDVNRTIVTTFAIGAALAGAAGVLYAQMYQQFTYFGRLHPRDQGVHRGGPRRDRQHPGSHARRPLPRRDRIHRARPLPGRTGRSGPQPAQGRDRLHDAGARARLPAAGPAR